MKRGQTILLCMLLSTTLFAGEDDIRLPQPDMKRNCTVMQALQQRCSTRDFATRELSEQDLGDLLWAANGVNRHETGKRTAPSALNRQDVDIYVVKQNGCYRYEAEEHRLVLVADGDYRKDVAAGQDFAAEAPVLLVLVSDFARMGDVASAGTARACALDAGIVSQNISLFCAAAELATVPRMTMDEDALRKALKLKDSQQLMLNHPVGYMKR